MSDEDEGIEFQPVTPSKRGRKAVSATSPLATPLTDDEVDSPPAFSLSALGLHRVGTELPPRPQAQPVQMLNARGMPARIRKRNRFFFDDDIINDDKPLRMSLSPKKTPLKGTPSSVSPPPSGGSNKSPTKMLKKRKGIVSRYMRGEEPKRGDGARSPGGADDNETLESPPRSSGSRSSAAASTPSSRQLIPADKKLGQRIGMRLRNLLKLPKAHKWVIFEWFYSFVDRPLFEGENDFQVCLADAFPQLRTRQLTRPEWRRIRALMGKPRRCSQAFFEEERRELERKRQKIRYMQTRKSGYVRDANFTRDLPEKIPLSLPVGTRVTARLRTPQDGIFSGTVDAVDSQTSTYRVTFERAGLGTHSIPDVEIVSENFHEMLSLQSISKDFRPNLMSVFNGNTGASGSSPGARGSGMRGAVSSSLNISLNKSDPLLGQEAFERPFKNPVLGRENINGYPVKLLETLIRLRRALTIKRAKLQRLSDMNNEAELMASQQLVAAHAHSSSDESERPEVAPHLTEEFQRRYASIIISMEKLNHDLQDYLNTIQAFAGELSRDPQVQAMLAPSYLREKCRETADHAVQRNNQGTLKNTSMLSLIKNLATVLLVASHLSNDENSAQVTKVLEGCIEEVKGTLFGGNVEIFQKNVQIHLHHIRLGIGQSMLPAATGNVPH